MLGKRWWTSWILLAALAGCAEPRYESVLVESVDLQDFSPEDCESSFSELGLCVLWSWEKMPTTSEPGSIAFKVVRANALDGSALAVDPGFTVDLILWMPEMGHGSTPTSVERVDVGSYRATRVFFIMPGKWELRFQLKTESVLQDEAIAVLTI